MTTDFNDICNCARVVVPSTYLAFSDFACILNISQVGNEKAHTVSRIKKQSEIYFIIPSVLLKVKRFKYHASILESQDWRKTTIIKSPLQTGLNSFGGPFRIYYKLKDAL